MDNTDYGSVLTRAPVVLLNHPINLLLLLNHIQYLLHELPQCPHFLQVLHYLLL